MLPTPNREISFHLLAWLNRLFCRVMYRVRAPSQSPLPQHGPVLLVSDHVSFCDPMVLAATAGRPIIFLTAREVFEHPKLHWLCRKARHIPVSRGSQDMGAVRTMLRALKQGEVVAIFPEGGINDYRQEHGHPGIGYLALKTGVPVTPASITWEIPRPLTLGRSLVTPGYARVRYGAPVELEFVAKPDRKNIQLATDKIMRAIRELRNLES